MAKAKSKKGKGKYAKYSAEGRLKRNKEKLKNKIENKLRKKKAWRKRKYGVESYEIRYSQKKQRKKQGMTI